MFDEVQIGKRLRALRVKAGLSLAQVAQRAGMSVGHISEAERGAAIPGARVLYVFAELGFDVNYILTGHLPQRRADRIAVTTAKFLVVGPEEIRKHVDSEYFVPIPVITERAALQAPLVPLEHDPEGYVLAPRQWLRPDGYYSCLRIKGESMLPVLADGDVICINFARHDPLELRHKLAAAHLADEGVSIKYVDVHNGRICLYAESRLQWLPRFITADERILGAVEWACRFFL